MKTKTIPFDLEMAKKIQAGEMDGKIKTRLGKNVLIVFWDKKDENGYVILALIDMPGTDIVLSYKHNGKIKNGCSLTEYELVLEVPDNEPKFKPFDKVLVSQDGWNYWIPSLYRNETPDGKHICIDNLEYDKCIAYEGNEHML